MAKAKRSISKNSPTNVPSDLTLDELLGQMLPHCDDDPFEVAKWANDRIEKKKGLRLLGDGIFIPPHLHSTHLKVVAKIARDGRATLEVQELRALGHIEKAEAIVGYENSGKESFDPFDKKTWGEPIKQSHDRLREPIKRWTVECASFEANRPDAPRNRGGRPLKYSREHLVTEALVYIAVNGTPDTLDGHGGLFEKLEIVLKPTDIPERSTLYNIFNPIWGRIEDERKRIEAERKKSEKKPGPSRVQ